MSYVDDEARHAHAVARERVDGRLQLRAAVADVRAEAEVAGHDGVHGSSSMSWRECASSTPSGDHSSPSDSASPSAA